jgi:hypothetical protein
MIAIASGLAQGCQGTFAFGPLALGFQLEGTLAHDDGRIKIQNCSDVSSPFLSHKRRLVPRETRKKSIRTYDALIMGFIMC